MRRSQQGLGPLAGVLALALTFATAQAQTADPDPGDWQYEPGRGLRNESLGLTLGGYVTGELQKPSNASGQARISHVSVFVWWEPADALKVFGELDQENVVARVRERGRYEDRAERRASLERLYATWTFDDALVLRGGKFLTPVGRWNQRHADPLTWTPSRPLLTRTVYPQNVTGVMASGTLAAAGQPLEYALYASNGAEWAPDPRQDLFSTVRGLRAVLPVGTAWQVGVSYARYEQRGSREPRELQGADLRWAAAGWEVSAEWLRTAAVNPAPVFGPGGGGGFGFTGNPFGGGGTITTTAVVPGPTPLPRDPGTPPLALPTRGAWVQAVAPLWPQWYAVVRVERVRDTASVDEVRQDTAGLVWRPTAMVTLKLERQHTRGRSDLAADAWTMSASVLF